MKRIGDGVSHELRRFATSPVLTKLVEAWPEAVGSTIARNAWPARIARDGTLHVNTSSASWAFELGQLQEDILRRVRAAVGGDGPERVRFRVGPLPERGVDSGRRPAAPPEPRPEDVARAGALAAAIEDDELRKLVAKAAAQSLFRAGTDRPV